MENQTDTNSIKNRLPDEEMLNDVSNLFKMFGDRTRVKILS